MSIENLGHILTITTEKLFSSEAEAYSFIDSQRNEKEVETSSVKYKKPTKKTLECWIVTIKERVAEAKDYIDASGEDENA